MWNAISSLQDWNIHIVNSVQDLNENLGYCLVVKSFSGATTSDIKHYEQMFTWEKMIFENKIQTWSTITFWTSSTDDWKWKKARVILSELMTRSENFSNDSVKTVNKKLWGILQSEQVATCPASEHYDLNKSGLHLTDKGNNIFFNNSVNRFNRNHWPVIDTYVLPSRSPNDQRLGPFYSFLPSKRAWYQNGKFKHLFTSLLIHIYELRVLLTDSPVDVLLINETRLDYLVNDSDV